MIEPEAPVTFRVEETPFPAFTLDGDQDIRLESHSVVLRHRHIRQQYTVISEVPSAGGRASPVRRVTRGQPVVLPHAVRLRSGSPRPVVQDKPLDVPSADPVRQAASTSQQPAVENVQKSLSQAPVAPPGVTINIGSAEVRMPGQKPKLADGIMPALSGQPSCVLPVERHEHMIRGLKDKTVWFSSRGDQLLTAPLAVPSPQLRHGDLFVHVATGNRKQVWLWTTDRWVPIQLHDPHPYLRGYVLNILANGEPSWVTTDTIRTYLSRIKKRERERSGKSVALE